MFHERKFSNGGSDVADAKTAGSVAALHLTAPLVELAADAWPDAPALRSQQGFITYRDLNARANRLAVQLRLLGAGPGAVVAICLERSFDQVATTLAIMKTGAAFLPIDLIWPDERIRTVLGCSGADILVARASLGQRLPVHPTLLLLDRDAPAIAAGDPGNCPNISAPSDLAFIIYTSGSTGTPKGVEITHGNLANFVAWHRDAFRITPADRSAYIAGMAFDGAVWDVWPYLAAGASASLTDDLIRTSPELLQRWMVEEGITVAFVTTVLTEPMLRMPWPATTTLRLLLVAGDTLRVLPPPHLPFALINCYGPTECTIIVTAGEVTPDDLVNPPAIGWPIASSRIYILDEHGEPCVPGQQGEITVGGPGVGRGYHRRPDLTERSFVPDRFSDVPGARMYRTGDFGCLLPDGRIAFRGRIDEQVKIRGNRVELEEVSHALSRHPHVLACVVVASGAPGAERRLIAYVVPAPDAALSSRELREFLTAKLPSYMVPAAFVRLTALPITANSKLNRRALPEPDAGNTFDDGPTRGAETPTELRLTEIVRGLLGVQQVGADDNFFALGGHSLLGTQVILRAREAFGVELTLRHLFEAQTVGLLAAAIERLILEEIEAMTDEEALALATA